MLHPATAPNTALPTAIPPASTTRYSPSPRARTHHGRARCVATLSVTVAVVHAPPATNSAGPAAHADSMVPMSTSVPAISDRRHRDALVARHHGVDAGAQRPRRGRHRRRSSRAGCRSRPNRARARSRTTAGRSAWTAAAGVANTSVRTRIAAQRRRVHAVAQAGTHRARERLRRQPHARAVRPPPQQHDDDAEERRGVDDERPARRRPTRRARRPSAGPIARPVLNVRLDSATACENSRGGTRSGWMACHAGPISAVADAESERQREQGRRRDVVRHREHGEQPRAHAASRPAWRSGAGGGRRCRRAPRPAGRAGAVAAGSPSGSTPRASATS